MTGAPSRGGAVAVEAFADLAEVRRPRETALPGACRPGQEKATLRPCRLE